MSEELRERLQTALGGAYRLHRELGGGGMSRVFLAEETRLGRKVVVKVLSPELAADISADRFEREIRLAASLQQANIVPLLAAGESEGLPYYTMPFVEGESLRSRLSAHGGALPIAETIRILRDIARALAYAHERGVVHRDIKPDNVLLSGGAAVVTDFGIAKAIAAARTSGDGPTLTQAGISLGTPAYMAPEQVLGDAIDHRADLYSLGCMAFELLTGHVPFHGRNTQAMLGAHLSAQPERVADARPDCPPRLAELVDRLLGKEPEARPRSASEVLNELEQVVTGGVGSDTREALIPTSNVSLAKALGVYAAAFVAVAILARAAVNALGLPEWVFPAALIAMALGLPAVLGTAYVHWNARKAAALTLDRDSAPRTRRSVSSLALKAHPHVTWRRAAMGGVVALSTLVLIVAGYMTLRALGIGPAGSLFAAGRLDEQDRLIVADFRAPASDSALGAVVSEAVRTTLSQSRAIRVLPLSAVGEVLTRMQRPVTTAVDFALAREIAEREGIKAVVHGDVAPVGGGFILTLRLAEAKSGNELASFREAARDATDVIPAIDRVTRALRGKIGESLKEVRASPPLIQVTTASLPALRKYTEAMSLHYRNEAYKRAAEAFEEAIALDSGFAMAYVRAGTAYYNAGTQRTRADSLRAWAFRKRHRLPALERALVEGTYYLWNAARDSAVMAYERARELDPHQSTTLNQLAILYGMRREWARAESTYRAAIALNDGNQQPSQNILAALVATGRLEAADSQIRVIEQSGRHIGPVVLSRKAAIEVLRGRFDDAERLLDSASRSSTNAFARGALGSAAMLHKARGKLSAAMALEEQVFAKRLEAGAATGPESDRITIALDSIHLDSWYREDRERAFQRLEALYATFPRSANHPELAFILRLAFEYSLAGRPDRARAVLGRFNTEVRDPVILRATHTGRRLVNGEIALAERDFPRAIQEFRGADTAYDGRPQPCEVCTYARLGRAYDLAGMPDSAIAFFERYIRTPSAARWQIDADYLAGAYKRLGELYEARGEREKALSHYLVFAELWKDADPELQPKLREVRARIARLRDSEPDAGGVPAQGRPRQP